MVGKLDRGRTGGSARLLVPYGLAVCTKVLSRGKQGRAVWVTAPLRRPG